VKLEIRDHEEMMENPEEGTPVETESADSGLSDTEARLVQEIASAQQALEGALDEARAHARRWPAWRSHVESAWSRLNHAVVELGWVTAAQRLHWEDPPGEQEGGHGRPPAHTGDLPSAANMSVQDRWRANRWSTPGPGSWPGARIDRKAPWQTDRRFTDPGGEEDRTINVALVRQCMAPFGPAPNGLTHETALLEIERIHRELQGEAMQLWEESERTMQHALASWTAARLRAAQMMLDDSRFESELAQKRIQRCIPILSGFAKRTLCGMVHGLSLNHRPLSEGGWPEDVRRWTQQIEARLERSEGSAGQAPSLNELLSGLEEDWEDLDRADLVERLHEALVAGCSEEEPRLLPMAEHVRNSLLTHSDARMRRLGRIADEHDHRATAAPAAPADDDDDEDGDEDAYDQPHHRFTRHRTAWLVGGDRNVSRLAELRSYFGFADVEWVEASTPGTRSLNHVVERMRSGELDLVIAMQRTLTPAQVETLQGVEEAGCPVVLSTASTVRAISDALDRTLVNRLR
jgi:hypothetical protein